MDPASNLITQQLDGSRQEVADSEYESIDDICEETSTNVIQFKTTEVDDINIPLPHRTNRTRPRIKFTLTRNKILIISIVVSVIVIGTLVTLTTIKRNKTGSRTSTTTITVTAATSPTTTTSTTTDATTAATITTSTVTTTAITTTPTTTASTTTTTYTNTTPTTTAFALTTAFTTLTTRKPNPMSDVEVKVRDTVKKVNIHPSVIDNCTTASNYTGHVTMTISGHICLNWSSPDALRHRGTRGYKFYNGDSRLTAKNYCRNADGNDDYVWCYTATPGVKFEACNVDFCAPQEDPCASNPCNASSTCHQYNNTHYKCVCTGSDCSPEPAKCISSKNYLGHVSVTVTGKTCQLWSSQQPHSHRQGSTDGHFLWGETQEGARNYCRDLDTEGFPWCYTTDRNTRWEPCHVNLCAPYMFPCESSPCQNGTACIQYDNTNYMCVAPTAT